MRSCATLIASSRPYLETFKSPELLESQPKQTQEKALLDHNRWHKGLVFKQACSYGRVREAAGRPTGPLHEYGKVLKLGVAGRNRLQCICPPDQKALYLCRPAYMGEYEKLQGDLQGLFTTYMEKFRNLEWLESQLEQHNRKEQERLDETERALKRMQRRIKDEVGFLITLRGHFGGVEIAG